MQPHHTRDRRHSALPHPRISTPETAGPSQPSLILSTASRVSHTKVRPTAASLGACSTLSQPGLASRSAPTASPDHRSHLRAAHLKPPQSPALTTALTLGLASRFTPVPSSNRSCHPGPRPRSPRSPDQPSPTLTRTALTSSSALAHSHARGPNQRLTPRLLSRTRPPMCREAQHA